MNARRGAAPPDPRDPAAIMDDIADLLGQLRLAITDRPATQRPGRAGRTLRCGPIALDLDDMRVTTGGETILLTARELLVLRYFLERPGQVVTRDRLLVDVWHNRYTGDARTVDVHVCRLRRKLPLLRKHLRTLKHVGYALTMPAPESASVTPAAGGQRTGLSAKPTGGGAIRTRISKI